MEAVSAGEKCEIERGERGDLQRQDKADFSAQRALFHEFVPFAARQPSLGWVARLAMRFCCGLDATVCRKAGDQIVTRAPSSTTRSEGMEKKSVAFAA